MASSMTGYGRAEYTDENTKITVEIKSVNNRYLDMNIRLPKKFFPFEAKIRKILQEYMQRGKVDVFISWTDLTEGAVSVLFNEGLAKEYLAGLERIAALEGVEHAIRPSDIARFSDVFTTEDASVDEESIWPVLSDTVRKAAAAFADARQTEGAALAENVMQKLDILEAGTKEVAAHEPEIVAAYREKLMTKLTELLADTQIDESRITQEAVIYADRISTDEESVRLLAHIEKMRAELSKSGSIGRSLDFLTQEMNREANTMLSKAGDVITSDIAITLKTTIEKIREQIQNIE